MAISPHPFVPTSTRRSRSLLRAQARSLLSRCTPRNDMPGGAVFPMSLRGHPKEAAAISPSSFITTSSRDCFVTTFLAMTCLVAPFSPCHCDSAVFSMSLRLCRFLHVIARPSHFYSMSLRGHSEGRPRQSHRPSVSLLTSTRRLLRPPSLGKASSQ